MTCTAISVERWLEKLRQSWSIRPTVYDWIRGDGHKTMSLVDSDCQLKLAEQIVIKKHVKRQQYITIAMFVVIYSGPKPSQACMSKNSTL